MPPSPRSPAPRIGLAAVLSLGACTGGPSPADAPAPRGARTEKGPAAGAPTGDATPRAAPAPPEAGASAHYTSVAPADCPGKEATRRDPERLISRCAGPRGYGVRIEAHDHGSELDITRDGTALGLRYDAPGWMADITEGKIEWRARGAAAPHALIFRVRWVDSSDDGNQQRSTLVVARIAGDTVCALGQTPSNERARILADDRSRRCP